jgi:hypothetical protein
MKRVFRGLAGLFALTPLLAPLQAHAEGFSRVDWNADFEQLQSLLATNYPSLERQGAEVGAGREFGYLARAHKCERIRAS